MAPSHSVSNPGLGFSIKKEVNSHICFISCFCLHTTMSVVDTGWPCSNTEECGGGETNCDTEIINQSEGQH